MLLQFHSIAFTHHNLDVAEIGQLHIEADSQKNRFNVLKTDLGLQEVMFLSTCNRVEFLIVGPDSVDTTFLDTFFSQLYPAMPSNRVAHFSSHARVSSGDEAISHILRVASSIDSLVIGEREIITQVRNAYDLSKELGLSGDFIRLMIKHTVETAKRVYTETKISFKPVSVVSIAYQRLQGMDISADARVLVIGAGVTNTAMCRFLKKHGMTQFAVFNRTLEKATALANELGGKAYPLSELPSYTGGFDVLVSCTGAEHTIVTTELYQTLLQGDTQAKVAIDLALPNDIAAEVHTSFPTRLISVNVLQQVSDAHLEERSQEVTHVEAIIQDAVISFKQLAKVREVELAMRSVPQMVKEIKSTAMNTVFKDELNGLDDSTRELLEKVVGYMEKKYMSMPMKMAKEILIKS